MEIELNKAYSTKEVAELLGVSYGTFRNDKEKYEERLAKAYKWKISKRKYIFTEQIGTLYSSRKEELYNEVYLPKVIESIAKNAWTTGAGVTNDIWTPDVMEQVQHLMSTAYGYVCSILGNEFDVTDKKYAACAGKGVYPRFMTDEEIEDWRKLKSDCAKNNGEKIMELTEQWVNGIIKTAEYNKSVKNLASGSFLEALTTWIETRGFIPVLLKHYERKNIEMRGYDWNE